MKKYKDIISINLISMLLGIGLYYFTDDNAEILAAIIATGISLSLGVRHYRTEDDKIFKELFTEFNNKYDIKFNNALEKIVKKSENDETYRLKTKNKKLIIDYINFCAEEYLWKTKNRIPIEVWNAWEKGMLYYLNTPLINEIVVKEKAQKDSYYGFYEGFERKINNLS